MKIVFVNLHRYKLPFWFSITPRYKKELLGDIISIGLNCYFFEFHFRKHIFNTPKSFKKPIDFMIGSIYKMQVASRSHVKNPYYVIISNVGVDFIETDIPNHHSLKINYPSPEWEYHIPRMILMSNSYENMQLIHKQKIL